MGDRLLLCAPVIFGAESVCADELKRRNFDNVIVDNGKVYFEGDYLEAARANLLSRVAERIQIVVGKFVADTFEDLFNKISSLEWERYIPKNGCFPVKAGHSIHSKLTSIPSCQSIIKKAISVRLGNKYGMNILPENGPEYKVLFTIIRDEVTISIDTTGISLHKRGYRKEGSLAPIRETLAATMVYLSKRRGDRPMIDPMCGSGTIAIEAAQMAAGIAPGINRSFSIEKFEGFDQKAFSRLKKDLLNTVNPVSGPIFASDIDGSMVELARRNAEKAGVSKLITFKQCDLFKTEYPSSGLVISNPPYGERIGDINQTREILKFIGKKTADLGLASLIISPDPDFEKYFGRKADKTRNIYNGMIKCVVYSYRPDKRLIK